jgi:2-polyprenyl-6-methoxyphenol hydroxylase-like FAD-dependent oxidoreductase
MASRMALPDGTLSGSISRWVARPPSSGATRAFDLVIAADGVHSVTRDKALGSGHVQDLGYRVSIFSVPNHLGLDREEVTYVSPGRTALMYSTAQDTGAKAMATRAGVWLSMKFLALLWKLPTKDKVLAKFTEPINHAANAITLRDYPVRCSAA